MKIQIPHMESISAPAKKPAAKKPAAKKPAAKKPAAKKPAAKAKLPESIQYLLEKSKPKLRLAFSQPGRYVMKNAKGVFSVFRITKEVKFTAGMKAKVFGLREMEALAGSYDDFDLALGAGAYSENEYDLLAESLESDSAAPGARNKAAGAKLGVKKRAPGMLAPGWHMFVLGKDNKLKKHYVGPRISGRRLVGIASGEDPDKAKADKAAAVQTNKDGRAALKESKQAASAENKQDKLVSKLENKMIREKDKTVKKEIAKEIRDAKTELRLLKKEAKEKLKAVPKGSRPEPRKIVTLKNQGKKPANKSTNEMLDEAISPKAKKPAAKKPAAKKEPTKAEKAAELAASKKKKRAAIKNLNFSTTPAKNKAAESKYLKSETALVKMQAKFDEKEFNTPQAKEKLADKKALVARNRKNVIELKQSEGKSKKEKSEIAKEEGARLDILLETIADQASL